VTCASNACTSAAGTLSFELKTTAAVGDPANGGKIASLAGLIATSADDSEGIKWTNTNAETGAFSNDGSLNTATIVGNASCSGSPENCAANLCNTLSITGGYTTNWYLPSLSQLDTLFTNKAAIGGFANDNYWSSSEFVALPVDYAWAKFLGNGGQTGSSKSLDRRVRCVRAFTP